MGKNIALAVLIPYRDKLKAAYNSIAGTMETYCECMSKYADHHSTFGVILQTAINPSGQVLVNRYWPLEENREYLILEKGIGTLPSH